MPFILLMTKESNRKNPARKAIETIMGLTKNDIIEHIVTYCKIGVKEAKTAMALY